MSYVVSVVRDSPIEREEVRALAGTSPSFEVEDADGICILHWRGTGTEERESFVLSEGSLDVTSPSDAALTIAQELAGKLRARVMGEEGEDLTDAKVSGGVATASGCGPFAGSILLVAALVAIYWFFN